MAGLLVPRRLLKRARDFSLPIDRDHQSQLTVMGALPIKSQPDIVRARRTQERGIALCLCGADWEVNSATVLRFVCRQ